MNYKIVDKVKGTLILTGLLTLVSGVTGVIGFVALMLFNVSLAISYPLVSLLIAIPVVLDFNKERERNGRTD